MQRLVFKKEKPGSFSAFGKYLERSLQQCSVHSCHTFQLLPRVCVDVITSIQTHAAAAVSGVVFDFVAAVTVLRNVVVVAARVSLAGKSGGVVEQKKAATGFNVLLNRVYHGCRKKQRIILIFQQKLIKNVQAMQGQT